MSVNCDPTALIQAARCFRCSIGIANQWIKDYLLCQWANKVLTFPPGANQTTLVFLDTTITGGKAIDLTNIGGVTTVSFPNLVSFTGLIDIEGHINLSSPTGYDYPVNVFFPSLVTADNLTITNFQGSALQFPNLAKVITGLSINGAVNVSILSFPALTGGNSFDAHFDNSSVVTLDLSALTSSTTLASFQGGTKLQNINIGQAKPANASDWDFHNNALSVASVNHLLARCVANPTFTGVLNLSGGTNAAPTGQGITDKATLIARGATVTTN